MSDDKTEQPTHKKLEDAREKGQVAVSRDLAKVAVLGVVAETAFGTQKLWRESIESLMNLALSRIGKPFDPAMGEMFMSAGILLAVVFSVFFVLCIVVGCISYWAQFGILISPESVTPKFDKLNPINGLKQLFSKKKLIELLMSVAKASIIGLIIYLLVKSELPTIISLSGGEPKDVFFGFFEMVKSVFHVILVLCLILAVIDFGMQKYFHIKGLMMDKEEIKREYKESEGDPLIKGKRKQLAMQWAMSGPAAKTKDANAVVVNPTHFAVALLYDPEVAGVPIVLTKGKDEVAHTIIKSAKDAGIPVIRHVWLARTLYATCRDDTVVPRSSYEAVAYVFAVVNELIEMNATDREIELEAHGDPPEAYQ